jgi:hypothetical protein
MIRHGIIQRPATDARPAATHSRVSMVIIVVERATASRPAGQQHRAAVQRSRLTVSSPVLLNGGRAIADISHKHKSP